MENSRQLRILVTGAGGYIGRFAVNALMKRNCYVIAADIRPIEGCTASEQIVCDIFSGDKDIFAKLGSPDVLLHMAWLDGFKHNSPRHIEYLPKHMEFLKNMLDGGLKQAAVMGTMHEAGYHEGMIDENTPCNPLSYYGIAKNALRQAMTVLFKEYPDAVMQWLRAYYIIGDDIHGNSIFSKICQAEADGKETFPFTSGKNKYDFISIEGLADQISAAVTQREVTGIINCCSGKPVALADKVEEFIKEHNFKIKLNYGAFPDRPYDSPAIWGSREKIDIILKNCGEL